MGIALNSRILLAAASIFAALALIVGATFAFFSDQDTNANNTFSSGSIDINIAGDVGETLPFNVSDMQPGDSATECAGVDNIGSLSFNWEFTLNGPNNVTPGSGGGNLNDVLQATIEPWIGTAGGPTSQADCDNDANWGTPIFNGFLTEGSYPDPMGQLDPGERAGFRLTVFLPNDLVTESGNVTDNDYQGASTSYDIQVDAYQLNDPAYSGT